MGTAPPRLLEAGVSCAHERFQFDGGVRVGKNGRRSIMLRVSCADCKAIFPFSGQAWISEDDCSIELPLLTSPAGARPQ